ncbi:MAG: DUF1553 domain-containing protein [Fuerstiella sp.]|jgi:hypothetical protein|nr:DUF1553 domain-containing protein [Fuerstiella sp.]
MSGPRDEVIRLTNLQLEGTLDESAILQLNELLRDNEEFVSLYVELIAIHGHLMWGAAAPRDATVSAPAVAMELTVERRPFKARSRRTVIVAAAVLSLVCACLILSRDSSVSDAVVEDTTDVSPASGNAARNIVVAELRSQPPETHPELKPLVLDSLKSKHRVRNVPPDDVATNTAVSASSFDFSDAVVVAEIDRMVSDTWRQHNLQPSPTASDTEWIRRACLNIVGRIPTVEESTTFLGSRSPRKKTQFIDELVQSTERSSQLAVIWANMLVGRTERRGVNRDALFEFLFDEFQQNAPWIDTVGELISASGRNDTNGATNFLLAHLNNEATPATAVTARLFLGEQLSCVQCHDHPFSKDSGQSEYWALNAFFKDTDRVTVPVAMKNPLVRASLRDAAWKLVDRRRTERMTFFENLSGQQNAVLPTYDGHIVPEDSTVRRREELARLLTTDSETKVAKAMVNRMWAHFFGYGFTTPIDDMGPHSVVSHPELLTYLTRVFVASGYDLQRLMKWIASSHAWQLSSEVYVEGTVDRPEHGEIPLFSRVYVRRMTPEQVYESIRVAVRSAGQRPVTAAEVSSNHRRQWVRQFARSYDTDENDEAVDFDGTIAQAMVMMNGREVDDAIRHTSRVIAESRDSDVTSPPKALDRVAMAMLTREPTVGEQRAFRRRYRQLTQGPRADGAMPTAVGDMMWAYLNSSEFVLVH